MNSRKVDLNEKEKALKELLTKDAREFMANFMATENLDLLNLLSG
jgi:hypothetical protein